MTPLPMDDFIEIMEDLVERSQDTAYIDEEGNIVLSDQQAARLLTHGMLHVTIDGEERLILKSLGDHPHA